MRTIIVDDAQMIRRKLRRLLNAIPEVEVVGELGEAGPVPHAVDELEPDAVFLDIEMPDLDGIDLARRLAAAACAPKIVFVTAYDSYAVDAFDVNAVDYVMKPVDAQRVGRAVERVRAAMMRSAAPPGPRTASPHRRRLILKLDQRQVVVETAEIRLIEAAGNYVRYHTRVGAYLCRGTLRNAEDELEGLPFCRVNRGAVVNVNWVRALESFTPQGDCSLILKDSTEIAVSRTYRESLERLLAG